VDEQKPDAGGPKKGVAGEKEKRYRDAGIKYEFL
jgi:hypothetical protein